MKTATKTMLFRLKPHPYVWHRKSDKVCGADWAAQVSVECVLSGLLNGGVDSTLLPGDWLIWRSDVRKLEGCDDKDFRRTYTPMGAWPVALEGGA